MKIKILLIFGLLFFIITPSVFAASSSFLVNAQKWYDESCTRRPERVRGEKAVLCYSFDKLVEIQLALNSHNQRIDGLETKVEELVDKIEELESSQPQTLIFANAMSVNGPNGSTVSIPEGFKSMTVVNELTGTLNAWAPQVSFDGGTTWYEQHRFSCGNTCQTVNIPILGSMYRFSPGGGSGNVTSIATLNKEPNAKVILFGQGVNYPFTSSSFDPTGYTKFVMTVGSGDNPQNLTTVSLQVDNGSGFSQTNFIPCDGGATCQLKEMSLGAGTYRVVVNGNGTNALFGAILRP